jgi:hypothetical protein
MKKTPLKRYTPLRAKTPLKKSSWGILGGNKRKPKANRTKKKAPPSLSKLKKTLDSVFSQYIRLKHADKNGYVKCYTCSTVRHWKEMQNGHFVSRTYLITRFNENNCRPQCVGCNMFHHGKPLDFEENLKKELGNGAVESMKELRHKTLKLDRSWYTLLIMTYSSKVKDMLH